MSYNNIKTIAGWIIIIGHLGLAVLALIVLNPYLEGAQIVDVLLVLSPITLAYFTSVVTNFVANPAVQGPGEPVNRNFAAVVILLPSFLVLFLAYLILRYPSDMAGDVSTLQRWIAGIEALLGTTVGLVVTELFPRQARAGG